MSGQGDMSPHVLFVWPAPHSSESRSGKGLATRDGVVLRKIAKLKLPGTRQAFTHAVRCSSEQSGRPRPPKAVNFKACAPYLVQEILSLKPLVIVPVGKIPCNALGIKGGMEAIAGQSSNITLEGKTFRVMPMLHPLTIRKRPALRGTYESHWDALGFLLKEGDGTDYLTKVDGELVDVSSLSYVMRTHKGPLGLDLETTGLSPLQGSILTVAVGTGEKAYGATIGSPDDLRALRDGLLSRSAERPLIVHGSRFEEAWFRRFLGVTLPDGSLIDTVLLAKRAFPGQPASLAALTARLLPELSGFKAATSGGIENPLSLRPEDLLLRNIVDAAILPTIYQMLMEIWTTRCSAYARQVAQDVGRQIGSTKYLN